MNVKLQLKKLSDRLLAPFGVTIKRVYDPRPFNPDKPYIENPEHGPVDLQDKLERAKRGEPFEFPEVVNTNQAIATLFSGNERIVELGGGTGVFAELAAHKGCQVTCSEFDRQRHEWAVENRSHPNITYVNGPVTSGNYDTVVAIEVIEHVDDFVGFLNACKALAPRAILSTPNRWITSRNRPIGPPNYYQHVREWAPGEFYWVLRCFWKEVELFGTKSRDIPELERIHVNSQHWSMVAVCSGAR